MKHTNDKNIMPPINYLTIKYIPVTTSDSKNSLTIDETGDKYVNHKQYN